MINNARCGSTSAPGQIFVGGFYYSKSATFTFPGNPALVAGVTVELKGWGAFDGKYIITQAVHTVSGSGYTTQIKLRRVLEGY